MLQRIGSLLSVSWYWILIFVVMAAIVFFLLQLQASLREQMAKTIETLLRENPGLCLERLNHNRRLKLLYRKPVLELWRLDAYMALGEDGDARRTISNLRKMKLEPRDKLELYQKELSFYASSGEGALAKQARDDLRAFLKEAKVDKEKAYAEILNEADIIIGVYVDHDTGLMKKLIGRAEHTKNDVMRGITQYRIAKLAWFKGDAAMVQTYLSRAGKNLQGTWYAPMIEEAKANPSVLETQ
ncbi:MAG: hypothetical protein PUD80_04155 [Firmicutes bacterium]|nr:hypothetical protein [Bacillota bacterium]